ncbi:MAG: type II toxin-antitoxin system VapC family toxin [Planctomycetes bacterium]|nr:type II toxin-antitoxin system VapC family toxin [Planctomycetota bacterium]
MSAVFADTSYYLALVNADDEFHALATDITPELDGPMVTTAWVLTEVGNTLRRGHDRALAVRLIRKCQTDPRVTVVPPSKELFDSGFEMFARRADKEWSLTDCISFVVMRERGIHDALSTDRHFEQAGFTILLK